MIPVGKRGCEGERRGASHATPSGLQRVVAMPTRMTIQFGGISEAPGSYLIEGEHEYEDADDKE